MGHRSPGRRRVAGLEEGKGAGGEGEGSSEEGKEGMRAGHVHEDEAEEY